MSTSEDQCVRRSERSVRQKRSYSPELICKQNSNKQRKSTTERNLLFDRKSDNSVCCNKCKSPFIVSPYRKLRKKIQRQPFPRHHLDSNTNQMLPLCNRCGLAVNENPKKNQKKQGPSPEEKEGYFQEAKAFSVSLADTLHDKDAERLFCPEFKIKPCACIQKFVLGQDVGNIEQSHERAIKLLKLLKEAKCLSQQKVYKNSNNIKSLAKPGLKTNRTVIGLGNGQKRSRQFEEFVLKQRKYLREEIHLCERATQRVLMYSNNFLHKQLRTEPERVRRVERKKGKAILGLLKPISELTTETCCKDNCVLIALSHSRLLHQWRERAKSGQAEARRVLAEMLTPSGGIRTNCYKFISLVTGCSRSTISKVNDQMRQTGGDREPPEHGLKKFWQEQAKKHVEKQDKSENTEDNTLALLCETIMSSNNPALDICGETISTSDSLQISLHTNIENIPSQNNANQNGENMLKTSLTDENDKSVSGEKVWKQQNALIREREIQQNTVVTQQMLPIIENDLENAEHQQLTFTLPLSSATGLDVSTQSLLSQQVIVEGQLLSNLGSVIVIHPPLRMVATDVNSTNLQESFKKQPSVIPCHSITSSQL